jgi:hypothetical protein
MLDRYIETLPTAAAEEEEWRNWRQHQRRLWHILQAAMLYRIELSIIRKRRAANVSETLASIA